MPLRNAIINSLLWVGISLAFAAGVYQFIGPGAAAEWLTAYIVEKSLSVDNLLVFSLLFAYFNIPTDKQPKLLYWGIWGAALTRLLFIGFGVGLISSVHWLTFLCGGFLLYTAAKVIGSADNDQADFNQSWIYRLLVGRVSYDWLVVAVLEATDIAFAVDSVPAALAVSDNLFILFTANMFAVLGLRSMYFVLAAFIDKLAYLKYGVSAVLMLVGCKLVAPLFIGCSNTAWLLIVASILAVSVVFSLFKKEASNG